MKLFSILLLSVAALLTGCVGIMSGHLYPVEGPLSLQAPPPIFPVVLSGLWKSGSLRATLQGAEVCRGNWTAISQADPSSRDMASVWDSVYGAGYFMASVMGSPAFARASLIGTQETTLIVQMYDPVPGKPERLIGVARDDKGNVFKLTF